jgi:hypothetical protein
LPLPSSNRTQMTRDLPPRPSRVRFQTATTSDDESASAASSESEPESSVASDDGKIAKPLGEAGRPHSGGYNLERELGWRKTTFKQLKVG